MSVQTGFILKFHQDANQVSKQKWKPNCEPNNEQKHNSPQILILFCNLLPVDTFLQNFYLIKFLLRSALSLM